MKRPLIKIVCTLGFLVMLSGCETAKNGGGTVGNSNTRGGNGGVQTQGGSQGGTTSGKPLYY